jgi:carbon monoxide dehydrogenase subunit G
MNVSGQFTVPAPREVVFEALRDARRFISFVDGVSDLREIDATHYAAMFETKVAYMKFRFAVTVEVTRLEPPAEIEARIEGTPLGIVGRLTATSLTRLTDAGDETRVDYLVDATLAGKLGSIGQPVLRAKAKDMERQFAEKLRAAFAPVSLAPLAGGGSG